MACKASFMKKLGYSSAQKVDLICKVVSFGAERGPGTINLYLVELKSCGHRAEKSLL